MEVKETEKLGVPPISRLYGNELPEEVSKEILAKSDEDLTNEAIEFMREEFPQGIESTWRITQLFWERKGIHRFAADPGLRLKMEKVDALFRHKQESERLNKERELIPKLLDQCVEWGIQKKLNKLTRASIDYFLMEKGVSMSKPGKEALYLQANARIRG